MCNISMHGLYMLTRRYDIRYLCGTRLFGAGRLKLSGEYIDAYRKIELVIVSVRPIVWRPQKHNLPKN